MTEKQTYAELEKRIQELEHVEYKFKRAEEAIQSIKSPHILPGFQQELSSCGTTNANHQV